MGGGRGRPRASEVGTVDAVAVGKKGGGALGVLRTEEDERRKELDDEIEAGRHDLDNLEETLNWGTIYCAWADRGASAGAVH